MSIELSRLVERVRGFFASYRELDERRALRRRPWEEDLLHWSRDGELHGHLSPPLRGRRRSVTSSGWCPGHGSRLSDPS